MLADARGLSTASDAALCGSRQRPRLLIWFVPLRLPTATHVSGWTVSKVDSTEPCPSAKQWDPAAAGRGEWTQRGTGLLTAWPIARTQAKYGAHPEPQGADGVTSWLTARPPSAPMLLTHAKARQTPILFSLRGGMAPSRDKTDTDTLMGKRKH